MPTDLYDACVIGSGAGGGPAAYALVQAGKRVALLEKGPHYGEADFVHDELSVCRRTMFVPDALREPTMMSEDGAASVPSTLGWNASCVGGGTVLMSGYFFRMHPNDFRSRSRHGEVQGATLADWPFGYDELEPFYDEVERIIGLSGQTGANPFEVRRAPYPLGPIASHPAGALIDAGAKKLGYHAFPTPRAINSAFYDGRRACHYCGFCGSYGCEVSAKSSTAVTFIPKALATGRLDLRPKTTVTRILVEQGRAVGVVTRREGREEVLRCRTVVLAAGAIQSARLWLASELPNRSAQVGKNLMLATFASAYGRLPLPHPAFAPDMEGVPFADRAVQDFYELPKLAYPKGGTLLYLLPHKNPIFRAERVAAQAKGTPPVFGAELKRRLHHFFVETRGFEVEAFSESLPHEGMGVELDKGRRDPEGMPLAQVRVAQHRQSLAASDELLKKGRDILSAAGMKEIGHHTDSRSYPYLACGTLRMGVDPASTVLDPSGQAHEVPGLYVADGSSFPSSAGAPFTLTILANALRVGHAINSAN